MADTRRQLLVRPIPDQAVLFIMEHEGLRVEPYRDVAGYWTIRFGHLVTRDRNADKPSSITCPEAMELLRGALLKAVRSLLRLVDVPLHDGQHTALLSFVFNLGGGALQASTLLRRLNRADYAGAAAEFPRWNKAGGKPVSGLTIRRIAEQRLFLQ